MVRPTETMGIRSRSRRAGIRQYFGALVKVLFLLLALVFVVDKVVFRLAASESSAPRPTVPDWRVERLKAAFPRLATDESGDYAVMENAVVADAAVVRDDVTWVTQCSVDHLHRIAPLATAWKVCF
ncbi:unnamed protein product, partial [Darwinula stevensoni]